MKLRSAILTTLVAGFSASSVCQASWLSDLTGVNIDVPAGKVQIGTPDPGGAIRRLPQTLQNLPQDIANLGNPAGLALAFAVRQAKAQAGFGARAMPADVYQQLSQFYRAEFLQSVTYNTFDSARITLDSAVMLLNNDVSAITLEDIIVFHNESEAHDPVLWAHELTHVQQYRNRGVDAFANMYTTNAWVLENEAKDRQNRIAQLLNSGGQSPFGCYWVTGNFLCADQFGNLYPADPQSGNVLGPPNGKIFLQNGQWIAQDLRGLLFIASRVM